MIGIGADVPSQRAVSSSLPPPASSLCQTGGSVVFVQMDQQTIADYPVGGAATTPTFRYVYASYIDEPVVRKGPTSTSTAHFYHRNHQYSVTAITTSTGAIAERYAYTAYGQPTILNASGTVISATTLSNRYTYTGREWDATLGLHHFRARWMSPNAGRFVTRDPIGYADGPILYDVYISLLLVDPLGTQTGSPGGGGSTQPANPSLPQIPGGNPPFLPQAQSCTISVCSSPVDGTGGVGGHLFILCGGVRYRGGPTFAGNQDPKCDSCDGKFGQLKTQEDPWADNPTDHPENPNDPYPASQLNCKDVTISRPCDEVCGCISKVGKAVNDCCVRYEPIPTPGPIIPGSNSNSVVGWMLEACADPFLIFIPPGRGIRVHPGINKPMPPCVRDAIPSRGIVGGAY
jgi:RHS repeat-associated protein